MTSSSSSSKRFQVFDFNEEDEPIESESERFLGKFGNPKSENSAITKYKFLECFAQGTKTRHKEIRNGPLDVDASGIGHRLEDGAVKEGACGLDAISFSDSSSYKSQAHAFPNFLDSGSLFSGMNSFVAGTLNLGVTSAGSNHLNSTLPQSPSDNERVGMISDDDDSIEMSSSSNSASDQAENKVPLKERVPERGFGGCELDNINMTVDVSPDYIIYGDIYCAESLLTFSCSCIKLEGSTVYGPKGTFSSEWTIGDIINIESQWCGNVATAIVNLRLKSKDIEGAKNINKTPGIEELQFAVYDPHWSKRQEAIKSLDGRYKAIWNVIFDADAVREEDALLGQSSIFFSKHYFSNFDEPFEDVIYPKGDPDAVSISKRDVELLQPETFVNDTIIDFYVKYLKNKIQPEEKHRFHFFNSFFFRKLADLDKDPSSACEGSAAFQRFVNGQGKILHLFYTALRYELLMHLNDSLHWSLIVICHPGDVATFKEEEIDKLPKVPCILHMDSIKGSHKGLKNLVQSYLWEEWKARQSETAGDVSSKFFNLRFVPLELPQQENSFDCGLFLLHYVELFLVEAPINFSPFKITKLSNFLNWDWFPPAEASLKRTHIRKLIYEVLEDNSQKVSPAASNDEYPSSELPDTNERESGVEFLQEISSSTKTCLGNASSLSADQGIEITRLAASPKRGVQYIGEPGLVFRESFEPGATAGSLTDGSYQPFGQIASLHQFRSVMSPIEEDEETGEQTAHSPSDKAGFQQVTRITTEPSTTSYIAMHLEEIEEGDSSSGTSISGSQISSEAGVDENHPLKEFLCLNHNEEKDKPESTSTSCEGLEACVVEDSQEASGMNDGNENGDSPSSCQGNILAASNQGADSTENIDLKAINTMPLDIDDPVSESDEHRAAKRQRLMAPEKGRRLTRSLSKDLGGFLMNFL